MRFELEPDNRKAADAELLADLRRVAQQMKSDTISKMAYREHGRFNDTTICDRFGSWNAALEKAGLLVGKRAWISDEELFANLEAIWRHLGRQPRRSDLDQVTTNACAWTYANRFGSWRRALEAFVAWVNADGNTSAEQPVIVPAGRQTVRQPSLRLRFRVLRRDRFCCRLCGRSPAATPGLELQVDHVVAWAEGGETVLDNLQTLCGDCNLGKSNLTPYTIGEQDTTADRPRH
jgi:hypothetical protein